MVLGKKLIKNSCSFAFSDPSCADQVHPQSLQRQQRSAGDTIGYDGDGVDDDVTVLQRREADSVSAVAVGRRIVEVSVVGSALPIFHEQHR